MDSVCNAEQNNLQTAGSVTIVAQRYIQANSHTNNKPRCGQTAAGFLYHLQGRGTAPPHIYAVRSACAACNNSGLLGCGALGCRNHHGAVVQAVFVIVEIAAPVYVIGHAQGCNEIQKLFILRYCSFVR